MRLCHNFRQASFSSSWRRLPGLLLHKEFFSSTVARPLPISSALFVSTSWVMSDKSRPSRLVSIFDSNLQNRSHSRFFSRWSDRRFLTQPAAIWRSERHLRETSNGMATLDHSALRAAFHLMIWNRIFLSEPLTRRSSLYQSYSSIVQKLARYCVRRACKSVVAQLVAAPSEVSGKAPCGAELLYAKSTRDYDCANRWNLLCRTNRTEIARAQSAHILQEDETALFATVTVRMG